MFTYSPMVRKLEDLYFDTGGILETSKSGSIFVDLSPATPSFIAGGAVCYCAC